jgi:DNA polymerase-3 subunit alpha
MFQGDGCINLSRKYPQIFYATSSPKMARDLQHLLLKLEIISTIHTKKFRYRGGIKIGYSLTINRYTNIRNFYGGPGKYLIGEKKKIIQKIVREHPIINGRIKNNSTRGSYDIIPAEIIPVLTEEIKKSGYSLKEFAKKYGFAERLFFRNIRKSGYLRETIQSVGKILRSQKLLELAQSDVYWDRIISIKKIGREKTYDLTIDGTHNYLANDIVAHNSHAACYALIGYQTAYLKAHFPAEFMAALLTSDAANIDRVAIEVSECREMGIEVLAPHINESFEEFAVIIGDDGTERIRFGLNAVKNVGHTVAREIVEERKRNGKYKSLTDLVERVQTKDLNKKSLEALAKVGALEGLGERNQIVVSMDNILQHAKKFQATKNSNQGSLFGFSEIALPEIALKVAAPASKKERLGWEKELLGLYISDHPVREYREYFQKMALPIKDINPQTVGQNISIGGVISLIHKVYLKNQKTMLFVTVEDLDSRMEILVFPKVLEATGSIWAEDKIILATGKISDKDGQFKLLCDTAKVVNPEEVEKFRRVLATQKTNGGMKNSDARPESVAASEGSQNKNKKIIIHLAGSASQEIFKKLSGFFDQCAPGEMKVYLAIGNSKLETPYCIQNLPGLADSLKNLVPEALIDIY